MAPLACRAQAEMLEGLRPRASPIAVVEARSAAVMAVLGTIRQQQWHSRTAQRGMSGERGGIEGIGHGYGLCEADTQWGGRRLRGRWPHQTLFFLIGEVEGHVVGLENAGDWGGSGVAVDITD
jgi:hypothetical protein